jgi:hypothetical protein
MAHITEEHLHHMARRHHATMKKLEGIREKVAGVSSRFVGTIETGAGAWLGGAIEGRTAGGTVLRIPINLGLGAVLLAVGSIPGLGVGAELSKHLNNVGNGLIGSYVAATGYAFGKRWRETGKVFGGGGHPWASPYENGWPHQVEGPAPAVHGDLNEGQMAAIVHRMQQAAAAPAHM